MTTKPFNFRFVLFIQEMWLSFYHALHFDLQISRWHQKQYCKHQSVKIADGIHFHIRVYVCACAHCVCEFVYIKLSPVKQFDCTAEKTLRLCYKSYTSCDMGNEEPAQVEKWQWLILKLVDFVLFSFSDSLFRVKPLEIGVCVHGVTNQTKYAQYLTCL